MEFPKLYKKSSDGKLQEWSIKTTGCTITTTFGDEGGKLQDASDTITEGKNLGKKNATTPGQQADSEAKSKWLKQIERKGYVSDRDRALRGESDAAGGISPMLAKKYFVQGGTNELEDGHKIKYPALIQPKLDGIRCVATIDDGVCTLWTRTQNLIKSVPHINKAYEAYCKSAGITDIIFDGELYSAEYADEFEKIVSLVRQEEPIEGHEVVEHWVYDLPSSTDNNDRRAVEIGQHFVNGLDSSGFIKLVQTSHVENQDNMMAEFKRFVSLGYEGAIIRNIKGLYVNKRSADLQKVVDTITDEFLITGIEEGRGKLQGSVGSFLLIAANGKVFKAKLEGELSYLKQLFDNHSLWRNKKMTVRYRALTRKSQVPRFPIGVSIRDYE